MVEVPAPAPPGLEIILDGKPLPSAQWGQPLFVDPGPHTLSATAKGYEKLDDAVEVKAQADRAVIKVVLKKLPPPPKPPPPKPPPPPSPPPPSDFPVWAVVVGSTGLAMMGVSIGFGIDTVSVGGELDDECGAERKACPSDYDFVGAHDQEVRSFGLFVGFGVAGIVATGVGAVGLGIGLAGGDESPTVSLVPLAAPGGAGLAVQGTLW